MTSTNRGTVVTYRRMSERAFSIDTRSKLPCTQVCIVCSGTSKLILSRAATSSFTLLNSIYLSPIFYTYVHGFSLGKRNHLLRYTGRYTTATLVGLWRPIHTAIRYVRLNTHTEHETQRKKPFPRYSTKHTTTQPTVACHTTQHRLSSTGTRLPPPCLSTKTEELANPHPPKHKKMGFADCCSMDYYYYYTIPKNNLKIT